MKIDRFEMSANILIVDDTPENLQLLSTMLTEQGYEIRCTINGKMALMGAISEPPDLILLDINMPQMNGYEVCQLLKAKPETCEIPVIFISALDDVLDKVKAFSVGGVDYITKPFQIEEVVARIENQLKLQKLQKQLIEQNLRLQVSEAKEREKSQQLAEALSDLQQAQAQIVQSEKMSSLGHLVAGIAHEINNPIGFIYGNIKYAFEHAENLLRLVKIYQNLPNLPVKIQAEIEAIDLEFIQTDLPKLLNSMKVGASRIAAIVQSLRNFSRIDEAELKAVDIHEGINSALMILQHRLHPETGNLNIEVVKEYGNLPQVECYAGELNQVFFNIIANAIDAIASRFANESLAEKSLNNQSIMPQIAIRTVSLETGWVAIAIADNGVGMPESIREHVFDPFFTTKKVGAGTGLGMSIAYSVVVDRHGGRLRCLSEPGQGTTFAIEIPVRQLGWKNEDEYQSG